MAKSWKSDIERNKPTEDCKRIDIDETIRKNERTDNNFKYQV